MASDEKGFSTGYCLLTSGYWLLIHRCDELISQRHRPRAPRRFATSTGSSSSTTYATANLSRALGGEQAAIDALTETAHYLGVGISNLIVGLSPEAVVVCGRITRAWPIIAPRSKRPSSAASGAACPRRASSLLL
jgi:predicted NBD/HSP70 family sugar kinase